MRDESGMDGFVINALLASKKTPCYLSDNHRRK